MYEYVLSTGGCTVFSTYVRMYVCTYVGCKEPTDWPGDLIFSLVVPPIFPSLARRWLSCNRPALSLLQDTVRSRAYRKLATLLNCARVSRHNIVRAIFQLFVPSSFFEHACVQSQSVRVVLRVFMNHQLCYFLVRLDITVVARACSIVACFSG